MKSKKIFLLFAAFIFAAAAIYNIHLAQSNQNSDVSLADITIMAQAEGESGGGVSCVVGGCGALSCSHTYTIMILGIGTTVTQSVTCSSGYHACCKIGSAYCISDVNC